MNVGLVPLGGPRCHVHAPAEAGILHAENDRHGGLATAALHPIEGAEQVARYLADLAARAPALTILERTVNGQPGLIAQHGGTTVTVFAFGVTGNHITQIWAVRNPDKLRPWSTG
jgi:hypothetical protein